MNFLNISNHQILLYSLYTCLPRSKVSRFLPANFSTSIKGLIKGAIFPVILQAY